MSLRESLIELKADSLVRFNNRPRTPQRSAWEEDSPSRARPAAASAHRLPPCRASPASAPPADSSQRRAPGWPSWTAPSWSPGSSRRRSSARLRRVWARSLAPWGRRSRARRRGGTWPGWTRAGSATTPGRGWWPRCWRAASRPGESGSRPPRTPPTPRAGGTAAWTGGVGTSPWWRLAGSAGWGGRTRWRAGIGRPPSRAPAGLAWGRPGAGWAPPTPTPPCSMTCPSPLWTANEWHYRNTYQ